MATHIPSAPEELTLSRWIGFCHRYGIELDKEQARIEGMADGMFKQLDMAEHMVTRFFSLAAYFHGIEMEEATRRFKVGEVTAMFENNFSKLFRLPDDFYLQESYLFSGVEWCLPPVELEPDTLVSFGEFIDSKVVVQNVKATEQTKWEMLHQVACIFFRPRGERYNQSHLSENSERITLLGELPMNIVLAIAEWFEQFNSYLVQNFSIFGKSNVKGGRYMAKHFEAWGWINFLTSIAKTKIFDLPNSGVNSIECARLASCYDVLMYASQEKAYNEAAYADMMAESKTKRP